MMDRLITLAIAALAGLAAAELRLSAVGDVYGGLDLETEEYEQVQQRLVELESTVAHGAFRAATLTGTGYMRAAPPVSPPSEEIVAEVLADLDQHIDERLEARKADHARMSGREGSKRLPLADVAKQLGLSETQQEDLRRIYDDTERRMLALIAGPDGDVEQVRRDLLAARENPQSGRLHMMKYAPNVMASADDILSVQADHDAAVADLLGPDKTKRLREDFVVEETIVFGPQARR